jgi:hypothetical protein
VGKGALFAPCPPFFFRKKDGGHGAKTPFANPTNPFFNLSFTKSKLPRVRFSRPSLGGGILIVSTAKAQRRALLVLALTLLVGASRLVTETRAAGAFAVGKCGAYGQAFDYAAEAGAVAAARKQCKGECMAVTIKRACAALAVDMANPRGAPGYAIKPRISSSLNAATKKCYEFGGKECVIRAWACDAKG